MGFKQHISRTWQMIEQQVNDVPFRPDYETTRQVKKQASYIGFTSFDAEKCAELKNSIINRLNGQSHYGIAHFQK